MNQIARNLTDAVDGLLKGKRYLIHDRDPLFTTEFLSTLADAGTKSVKLPPRSPNLNCLGPPQPRRNLRCRAHSPLTHSPTHFRRTVFARCAL
jgi:hypothetical protein